MSSYGEIRIIGGSFRGRKLLVPDIPDLRPTPNRVRETLFNWLAPYIQGAYCLDPFAGSGALGFEAISRGASHVVMIDQSPKVVSLLQDQLKKFHAEKNATIYLGKAPEAILVPPKLFDIVFLDPPFQQDLLLPTCFFLAEKKFFSKQALVYLEANTVIHEADLPPNWSILKSKKAGSVGYHLVQTS